MRLRFEWELRDNEGEIKFLKWFHLLSSLSLTSLCCHQFIGNNKDQVSLWRDLPGRCWGYWGSGAEGTGPGWRSWRVVGGGGGWWPVCWETSWVSGEGRWWASQGQGRAPSWELTQPGAGQRLSLQEVPVVEGWPPGTDHTEGGAVGVLPLLLHRMTSPYEDL